MVNKFVIKNTKVDNLNSSRTNRNKILDFLEDKAEDKYCDDCLSEVLNITPRQQVNQMCRPLANEGKITRRKSSCSRCGRVKLCNSFEEAEARAVGKKKKRVIRPEVERRNEKCHPNLILTDCIVHVLSKSNYFKPFSERRMSSERWVQGEIIHKLESFKNRECITDYKPEKRYPQRDERCDIYFEIDDSSCWVELQSVQTNYCGEAGKPITNQIEKIKKDGERLSKFSPGNSFVLFPAYPFSPDGSDDQNWQEHLDTLEPHFLSIRMWEFAVGRFEIGRIYLMEI